jgi:hypothetical protein
MPSLVLRRVVKGAALAAVPLFLLLACEPSRPSGTGGAPDCSGDPFVCADGETCWPNDNVTKWDCIEAKAGQGAGAPCKLVGGQVSCDEDMVCIVQGAGDAMGVCTPYCDPSGMANGCAVGACVQFTINTASGTKFVVHACDPDGAGTTSSSASSSASGSGSSSSGG